MEATRLFTSKKKACQEMCASKHEPHVPLLSQFGQPRYPDTPGFLKGIPSWSISLMSRTENRSKPQFGSSLKTNKY